MNKENQKKISGFQAAGAISASAAFLLLTILASMAEGAKPSFIIIGLASAAVAALLILSGLRFGPILSILLLLIIPFTAFLCLENYTHVLSDPEKSILLNSSIMLLNLMFYYLIYGILLFLTGSLRLGYAIGTILFLLLGLINYFVVEFRGTPVMPWDLLSIKTALSVTGSYHFTFPWKIVFSLMGFVWMLVLAGCSTLVLKKPVVRIPASLVLAMLIGLYIVRIQDSQVQSDFGMDTILFTPNVLYRNNGTVSGFLGILHFLNIEEPDGYSVSAAEQAANKSEEGSASDRKEDSEAASAAESEEAEESVTADSQMPTIIVIMNEAFSDLSVYGDFAVSQEVMPYFKALQQEAIGGTLYVSVKGGNTANSEFEFLTSDSMAFLPSGSVPYQQYIHADMPNLTSYLKSLGYQTTAIHPYNKSGWNRDKVYEYFGFDTFLGKTDFTQLISYRGYASDQSAFEKIISEYEANETDDPMFLFEVTMQNHGGYSKENPDFDSYVKLTDEETKTTGIQAVEKYLTLMNMTDQALEELVEYFRQEEKPVILLMFGDHQPSDYITNIISSVTGYQSDDSLEALENTYKVPFVMWSNYDLEPEWYDALSVNYLSGLLMEKAGLPLTGYQQFLAQLRESLPVINATSCMDAEGNFYEISSNENPWTDLLNDYQILQYNHLVDTKNRLTGYFDAS